MICSCILAFTTAAFAAEPPHPLPVLAATVTKVNDCDSIEVKLDSGPARVRMSAIDTPEYDQPYGSKSSAAMKAMLPVGSAVELEVVTQDKLDRSTVFGAIDSLVAKSLVATFPVGAMMRYRLLDTTRAYALEISLDDA